MSDRASGAARIEAALEALLPPGAVGVVWSAEVDDVPDTAEGPETGLAPEESQAIRGAVPSRRREFGQGRACAREALRRLGGVPEPIVIPVGPSRAPVWPPGVTGSITHCAGLVAAVAARVDTVVTIGVDAEPARPLPPGVRDLVLTAAERARHPPDDLMETIVFSAKEAIHKAIHPVSGVWLDFLDVELAFDADGGAFQAAPAPSATPADDAATPADDAATPADDAASAADAAAAPADGPPTGSRHTVTLADLVGRHARVDGFVLTVAYATGTPAGSLDSGSGVGGPS